ncbi:MAG: class I SAM-dependent methyltransferase [Xanthomonadales bacterium]|nr:class I SAM-dependent methyltransferase [Xanthomonadales bacterium]
MPDRLALATAPNKQYDRAYFDRWYRDPAERRLRQTLTAHKAAVAVSVTECLLGRPLRSVLDVGCGEGDWRAPLRKLRPRIQYLGLDSSDYAVERFGRARNLRLLDFAQLEQVRPGPSVDLLVCSDVMHYLPNTVLRRGLRGFAELCHGVAYLDLFCRGDAAEGDEDGFIPRPATVYRRWFAEAGLRPLGMHCYATPALHGSLSALERLAV